VSQLLWTQKQDVGPSARSDVAMLLTLLCFVACSIANAEDKNSYRKG